MISLLSLARAICVMSFYLALLGCETTPELNPYEQKFRDAGVHSMLVVPVVNQSVDVDAPTSVLSSLPIVLANHGYYVFGVNTTKVVLEHEGMSEPAEVHAADPVMLASMFGADSIVYVEIERWTSQYVLLQTTTIVDLKYRIVNRDGQELWSARKTMSYSPQSNASSNYNNNGLANLLASAVVAAIEKANPKYMELTRRANDEVFLGGASRLPVGPYLRAAQDASIK